MTDKRYPPISPVRTGFTGRCPRCGRGKLFQGFLTLPGQCDQCGLDYGPFDSGDGPAVFVILIAGALIVAMAFWVEMRFHPPYWLQLTIWIPAILIVSLGLLRPLKGLMIALQYKHKAREHRYTD